MDNVSPNTTAGERFLQLDGQRTGILLRLEQFALWTIPKLFPEANRRQDNQALVHDFQALGAQAVNSLSNRLMMVLFAPSRPFFRLSPNAKMKKQLEAANADTAAMDNKLSQAESEAAAVLDRKAIRPSVYQLLKLLIVTGNALMVLGKKVRVLNLRNYVVKRDQEGEVLELVIRERVLLDSLDKEVRALVHMHPKVKPCEQGYVYHYRWIKRKDNSYRERQWVDEVCLPAQYESKYTPERLPYRAVTWDLAAGDDYGTGLVEDCAGDFASLSALSKAAVQGAILASEFRWLVKPTAMTKAHEFEESENGAALAGEQGDITPINTGIEGALNTNIALQAGYVNRIGSAFMLQSAVTRQAERVTAEEIRANALELEGGLGGAYSRIAVDVQLPMAFWTLKEVDRDILGSDIEPTVLTGLDALSRSGDRDKLMAFGQGLAGLLNLPPQALDRLRLSAWMDDLASAEGLDRNKYVITDEEYNQIMQARAQQEQDRQVAVAQARVAQQETA